MSVNQIKYLKILTALICVCGFSFPVFAETVSQNEAKIYAQKFFNIYHGESVAPVKLVYNGKRLTTDRLFTPFYLYNNPRGGFVVISAENKTYPVLAYNLTDTFDPDKMGSTEQAIFRNYALDIENIRYDSRIPENAILAWQNFDEYIKGILNSSYTATDPTIDIEEAAHILDYLWTTDAGLDSYADLYTPGQWQEMVDSELESRGSAALAFIDSKGLYPSVVYGKKGDFYKIHLDQRGNTFYRLQASELLSDRQLLSTLHPTYMVPEPSEDIPFVFYEDFTRSIEDNDKSIQLIEENPIVKNVGGGHFDVLFPENVTLAMIYNINGSHVGRRTYKNTNLAHINIEAVPSGFYFALVLGESGKPYGIKLYR